MDKSVTSLTPDMQSSSRRRSASSRTPSARRMKTDDSDDAGRVWAREPESDPWAPCLLTLDGGGIRGYSSLLILKELMHHVWEWENKLDDEQAGADDDVEVDSPMELEADGEGTTAGPRPFASGNASSTLQDETPSAATTEPLTTVTGDTRSKLKINMPSTMTADMRKRVALSEDDLLPCHYFDFMYGTSTGGLIATILGRLRMSVTDGLELYRNVGDTLFGKRRSYIPLTTKYYHEPLERAVRDLVAARCRIHPHCDGNDMHPLDDIQSPSTQSASVDQPRVFDPLQFFDVERPRVCHSCCLAAANDEHVSEAYLLRTYDHFYSDSSPNWITRYNQGADLLPIWQVTRATTAAPFYFDMVTAIVDGVEKSFKDGGIRENNPSGAAMSEFHAMFEGKLDRPALLLSVGTGRPDQRRDGFAATMPGLLGRLPFVNKFLEKRAVISNLLIKYTEGEHQHLQMREHAHGENTWYKRLNVSAGLEDMSLDDWTRGTWHDQANVAGGASLTRMETATAKYVERDFDPDIDSYAPPGVMLRHAAEKLVRQRRARERMGGKRWAVFRGLDLEDPTAGRPA